MDSSDTVPVEVGVRVVRGPDWEWGELDGGEGHVGTVVEVEESMDGGHPVIVQWDSGSRCRCRCGVEGKFDLRVLDSAPTGVKFQGLRCFGCRSDPLWGMQWRCTRCSDYQLCTQCYMADKHSMEHAFYCVVTKDRKKNMLIPRDGLQKMTAYGFYKGAVVSRGCDWKWGDQDGGVGNTGTLVKLDSWKDTHDRSVAHIQWDGMTKRNLYRIGLKGKVDLVCVEPATGGQYYPEHLPLPGAPFLSPGPKDYAAGDKIKADIDMDMVTAVAAASDNDEVNQRVLVLLDSVGTVESILDNGDLLLRYPDNSTHTVSPEAATKQDVPSFEVSDVVRIIDDIGEVYKLQQEHGGWSDDMALALGQHGVIVTCFSEGTLRVLVNGKRWTMNASCLEPTPDVTLPLQNDDDPGDHILDVNYQLKSRLYRETGNPELLVLAAAAGDVGEVERFLENDPSHINILSQGQTALHIAVIEGYINIIKVLLRYNPNQDTLNKSGEKALHLCGYKNQVECAKLLLEAQPDQINTMDGRGHTTIMVAAAVGSHALLRYLVKCPDVNLDAQDVFGVTALHHSINSRRTISACILLEAGADPTVVNGNGMTAIHDAAGFGHLVIMEQLMIIYPQHANLKKENDHVPLHVAAVNNKYDVLRLLCQTPTCDINIRNNVSRTTLQCATIEGHTKIMWALVGYGADLNHTDLDGNTALHILLVKKNSKPPDEHTPQILQVQAELLELTGGSNVPNYLTVACFLVQEGTDVHIKNRNGQSPSQLFPPDRASLIHNFLNKSTRGAFHGSLKDRGASAAGNQPVENPAFASTVEHSVEQSTTQPLPEVHTPPKSTETSPQSQDTPIATQPQEVHPVSYPSTPTNTSGRKPAVAVVNPLKTEVDKTQFQQQLGQSSTQTKNNLSAVEKRTKQFPDSSPSGSPLSYSAVRDHVSDKSLLRQNSNEVAESFYKQESSGIESGSATYEPCFLCEVPSNVKFEPCGHAVMCRECAERTKRCPFCRVIVENQVQV